VSTQHAITMDWVATFLEAAGVAAHPDYPLDGLSLLANLGKPEVVVERELFWRMKFRDQKAVRAGRWKWLSIEGHEYLFDLSKDPRERANLAKREPQKRIDLEKRYLAWEASVPPIPPDARVSLIGGPEQMAQPS
jgi:arylsulfatase A-like enzyme